MKRSSRVVLFLLAALLAQQEASSAPAEAPLECVGPPGTAHVIVIVDGVRSSTGLIAVTLYADNRSRFLVKHGSLYVGRVPAEAPRTKMCLNIPAPGIYGLAVYHDADGNQRFNRTALGLPAEAYGFSNNPGTFFGLPNFSSVRIDLAKSGLETTIHLKYP